MIERVQISTSDGVTLETKVDIPATPSRVTVLCHPHPLQGGSMNAPLMIAVTQRLLGRGHTVVRFNFRGTGESSGSHEDGVGEIHDVTAAMDLAREVGLPLGLAGWSFGAAVAMNWLASSEQTQLPYVGIAPPPDRLPESLPQGPKRVILGTREQVIDADRLQAYAVEKGIDLVLTPGDHFFHGRGDKIGELVAQGLES